MGAGAPPSPGPAPSAAAHGCHFPQVGTQGRWVMAVWASMTPGVPLEVPRGGKTSLTGTRAKHGERQGALSIRELPAVQASGGGKVSASPHMPHSTLRKTGLASACPVIPHRAERTDQVQLLSTQGGHWLVT